MILNVVFALGFAAILILIPPTLAFRVVRRNIGEQAGVALAIVATFWVFALGLLIFGILAVWTGPWFDVAMD